MEDVWKVRMNIFTTLWSFVNFCCLSQSEVSTDNRKVSTFFAFQQVRCRCCYRSYLDRFLILFKICVPFDMYCIEKKKDIIIMIIIIIIITIIIIIIIIIDQQENRYNSETASKWLQKLKSLTDTTKAWLLTLVFWASFIFPFFVCHIFSFHYLNTYA